MQSNWLKFRVIEFKLAYSKQFTEDKLFINA